MQTASAVTTVSESEVKQSSTRYPLPKSGRVNGQGIQMSKSFLKNRAVSGATRSVFHPVT